jgi:crotonobetaine/carnitine-CoA ligase
MEPPPIGVGELLERQAEAHPELPFLSFQDGTTWSFGETRAQAARVRGFLASRGVEAGDRVALMLKNSLFFPAAWLGIIGAGAVAVPINSRLGPDDTAFILGHSHPALLLVDGATASSARSAAERVPGVAVVEVQAGEHVSGSIGTSAPRHSTRLDPATVANIQYTSGTTGFPKGCILTHGYWQRMGAEAVGILRLSPEKRILTCQPFSYIDPMWNVVAALQAAAHLIVLDSFHPSTFMAEVGRWRINSFYCLGAMPTLLMKQPESAADRDNALELIACSAIPPELHARLEQRWGAPWFEVFGMTETGINIAVSPEEHDRLVGSGSIGRPLPHIQASIADENGREVPAGETGELRIRGDGFMQGYLDNPEATDEFFRGGWANTGDLALLDEEGLIYLRGRKKEIIRRGGENVSQAEVEFAFRSHEDVLDCAVAAVPDEVLGEEGKAYLVMRAGTTADPEGLRAFLAEKLASFKVPRYFEFREDLPRTPSERVAKARLEEGRSSWRAGTYDAKAGVWLEDGEGRPPSAP